MQVVCALKKMMRSEYLAYEIRKKSSRLPAIKALAAPMGIAISKDHYGIHN